mgnify:CR=1 FL=1
MVKDWAYRVALDRKYLPVLEQMAQHIRETHDTDMIEEFNARCERHIKGQADAQFLDVTKTDDLVVTVGLQQCINLILGTSSARWSHMSFAMNAGTSPPAVTDTILDSSQGGPFFIPMSTYGWMEARGMKLFFGAIADQEANGIVGTDRLDDMGVYNGGTTANTLLNRENFTKNRPTRNNSPDLFVYNTVFIFSSVIEFCPVA